VARGGSNFTQFLANLPAETSAEDSASSDATARLIGALGPDTQEAALALPEHALTHSASLAEHRAAEGPEVSDQLRRAQQVVAIVAKVRQGTKAHCWEAFWRVYMLKHETNEVAREVGMKIGALHECLSRTRRRLREELIAADPRYAKYLDAGKQPPTFPAEL
jgi:DNA-directed RNA polymerase specialized sigma24 family protein